MKIRLLVFTLAILPSLCLAVDSNEFMTQKADWFVLLLGPNPQDDICEPISSLDKDFQTPQDVKNKYDCTVKASMAAGVFLDCTKSLGFKKGFLTITPSKEKCESVSKNSTDTSTDSILARKAFGQPWYALVNNSCIPLSNRGYSEPEEFAKNNNCTADIDIGVVKTYHCEKGWLLAIRSKDLCENYKDSLTKNE